MPNCQTGPESRNAALALALMLAMPLRAHAVDCLDTDAALEYWRPLKAQVATTGLPADELAIELESCLASPNPELRDGIGYELYAHWLRDGKLSDETRRTLLHDLRRGLEGGTMDATLRRSFSALILAEVMRSDAQQPFMSDTERQGLLDAAAAALAAETDFRGLDPDLGWVHPVAHMADLLWRFALHPATTPEQAGAVLEAVHSKIAPATVFYRYNEADRLARAVTTAVRRGLVDSATVVAWLKRFQARGSGEKWSTAFQSAEGMAELHNTKLFLRALSDQLAGEDYDPEIADLLHALVQGFTLLI